MDKYLASAIKFRNSLEELYKDNEIFSSDKFQSSEFTITFSYNNSSFSGYVCPPMVDNFDTFLDDYIKDYAWGCDEPTTPDELIDCINAMDFDDLIAAVVKSSRISPKGFNRGEYLINNDNKIIKAEDLKPFDVASGIIEGRLKPCDIFAKNLYGELKPITEEESKDMLKYWSKAIFETCLNSKNYYTDDINEYFITLILESTKNVYISSELFHKVQHND